MVDRGAHGRDSSMVAGCEYDEEHRTVNDYDNIAACVSSGVRREIERGSGNKASSAAISAK